ncbi:hypothetical protein ACQU0X_24150 [Pseudovibrio ascidiaceicola]|uniref:hypothetical protein n=1 Tax=Pseudovibrio ascidiaceicola TaxID=285279 RepID=UPI003D362983
MTLPNSGKISLSQVRTELGATGKVSLGSSAVRDLAGVSSGKISMSDLHGKQNFNEGEVMYQGRLFFEVDTNNNPSPITYTTITNDVSGFPSYGKCDPVLVLENTPLDPESSFSDGSVPLFRFIISQEPGEPINVGLWYHGPGRATAGYDIKLMQPNYLKGLQINDTLLEMIPQAADQIPASTGFYGNSYYRQFRRPGGSLFNLTANVWHDVILYNPF